MILYIGAMEEDRNGNRDPYGKEEANILSQPPELLASVIPFLDISAISNFCQTSTYPSDICLDYITRRSMNMRQLVYREKLKLFLTILIQMVLSDYEISLYYIYFKKGELIKQREFFLRSDQRIMHGGILNHISLEFRFGGGVTKSYMPIKFEKGNIFFKDRADYLKLLDVLIAAEGYNGTYSIEITSSVSGQTRNRIFDFWEDAEDTSLDGLFSYHPPDMLVIDDGKMALKEYTLLDFKKFSKYHIVFGNTLALEKKMIKLLDVMIDFADHGYVIKFISLAKTVTITGLSNTEEPQRSLFVSVRSGETVSKQEIFLSRKGNNRLIFVDRVSYEDIVLNLLSMFKEGGIFSTRIYQGEMDTDLSTLYDHLLDPVLSVIFVKDYGSSLYAIPDIRKVFDMYTVDDFQTDVRGPYVTFSND